MVSAACDVFISYKAEERQRLTPLVDALEAEGFSVWWDQNIGGGTNWREEIETHLDAARVVIVVWSKRSIAPEGRFVRDEAGQAQEAGHYLPITIDNVRPPLGFREVQALDLSSWWGKRDDPRFKLLCDTIRHRLEGKEIKHYLIPPKAPAVSRRTAIAGGIGTAAIAATGGWLLLKPSAAQARRIAVLPFANLSGAETQAYFAEGIAEELRAALSRVGMEVIGRASSDAVKDLDTKTAADKLGVAHILSGSVRRSPDMVRINAQLVGGKDGVERWAQHYDRAPGDEIKIQTDIATNVAQALSVALGQAGKAALTLGGTTDAAAQDLFLRGRLIMNTKSGNDALREAIALFDAAIARDPNYADPWRLKASSLEMIAASGEADLEQTLAQAEAAARRAIAIAPNLGPAYLPLAVIESDRSNYKAAFQHMERALELSPDHSGVLSYASIFMETFGDPRKAVELADRVIALDPLKGVSYARRGQALASLRDFPASIAASRKALELSPELTANHAQIAACLILMNRPAEARTELGKLPKDDIFGVVLQAILAVRTRELAEANRIVTRLREEYGDAASYQYAEIEAQLGNADRAFAELDNAVQVKDPGLQALKIDYWLDPIRADPRFAALLKRLNFPTWS